MMVPRYGNRAGWTPKGIDDFGDGGAYPELHVPQDPISKGFAIVKKDLTSFLPPSDLTPVNLASLEEKKLVKPNQVDLKKKLEDMKAALQEITSKKISSSLPTLRAEPVEAPKFINYKPQDPSSQSKIIKIVVIPKDPLEPPKFRINKKIPQSPPSPPAPVLHSPPRKPSVAQQKEWKIPPCISNWKNPKGFTIPLDKRLAADARGSQSLQINEKFAKLAESLFVADRKAREGIELRAALEKKRATKEKEKKEEILKKLAKKAREERAGHKRSSGEEEEEEEEEERNNVRKEKKKERRREKNMERSAPQCKNKAEREISEQIALNLTKVRAKELEFDQRIMNQTRGLSSGFTEDDSYGVYNEPWKTSTKNIYRPRQFVADTAHTVNEDIFGIDGFLKEAKTSTKRKSEEQ